MHPEQSQTLGMVGNRRTSQDHAKYSITKIGQNTGKGPGDLRRLATSILIYIYREREREREREGEKK